MIAPNDGHLRNNDHLERSGSGIARRAPVIGALSAAAALAASSLLIAPATQATQPDLSAAPTTAQKSDGASVTFFGHYCGEGDSGSKPKCDYTPTEDQSYGGFGPFTIHVDGKLIEKCPQGRFCGDQGEPSLPADSTVMIKVFGPPGMVTAGSMG